MSAPAHALTTTAGPLRPCLPWPELSPVYVTGAGAGGAGVQRAGAAEGGGCRGREGGSKGGREGGVYFAGRLKQAKRLESRVSSFPFFVALLARTLKVVMGNLDQRWTPPSMRKYSYTKKTRWYCSSCWPYYSFPQNIQSIKVFQDFQKNQ